MELRPYQKEAIKALWGYWRQTPQGRPIIVAPTGAGKSAIISFIVKAIKEQRPAYNVLMVTHRKELIEQNARDLQSWMPDVSIGIYSAGLGERRIKSVTYAGVQSLYKKAQSLPAFHLVIIDECHLIPNDSSAMYQKLLDGLQDTNPKIKILGLTATPYRMDQGTLLDGNLFTDIVFDISVRRLMDEGFLSPLVSMNKKEVSLENVRLSGYDYNQSDLESAFCASDELIEDHVREIIAAGSNRKSWLIFCAGVDHAKKVTEELKRQGVTADYVTGEHVAFERDRILRGFISGDTRALANCQILTTGFNHPGTDLVVLLRSTRSTSLYVQMVGRGSRIAPGKTDCMVLDFGGNIKRHGPFDLIEVKTKKGKKAEIKVTPHKECPKCGCSVAVAVTKCPSCDYLFPPPESKLAVKASSAPILSTIEEFKVSFRKIKVHEKSGGVPSLRLEYVLDGDLEQSISEYLCFDHEGFAQRRAHQKWIERGGQKPSPDSVDEAYQRREELLPVKRLKAQKKGKFYEIISTELGEKLQEFSFTEEELADHF